MTVKVDFINSLQSMNDRVDQLVAYGISRDAALDAALMAGLGSKEGVGVASALRSILQYSKPIPGDKRAAVLQQMIHAFAGLLVGREYTFDEISLQFCSWGYAGTVETRGIAETARALRNLADDISAEANSQERH